MQLQLHSLKHVSTAIDHAERLAEEAEELGQPGLASSLSHRARVLSRLLDDALLAHERIGPAREARHRAHTALSHRYTEISLALEEALPAATAKRLNPGSHLDVAERARFRLRHLMATDPKLAPLTARLREGVHRYEQAVDAYLWAVAEAAATKERAVTDSQAFRLALERAKLTLLDTAEVGSAAYHRIKRRAVRTKRARWLQNALPQGASPQSASPLAGAVSEREAA